MLKRMIEELVLLWRIDGRPCGGRCYYKQRTSIALWFGRMMQYKPINDHELNELGRSTG
jgi:hypothetical protein